jgi:hypothetical protein
MRSKQNLAALVKTGSLKNVNGIKALLHRGRRREATTGISVRCQITATRSAAMSQTAPSPVFPAASPLVINEIRIV